MFWELPVHRQTNHTLWHSWQGSVIWTCDAQGGKPGTLGRPRSPVMSFEWFLSILVNKPMISFSATSFFQNEWFFILLKGLVADLSTPKRMHFQKVLLSVQISCEVFILLYTLTFLIIARYCCTLASVILSGFVQYCVCTKSSALACSWQYTY